MKVATIIALFPSGWKTLFTGSDISEAKEGFKLAKVRGSLTSSDGESASEIYYFDTSGRRMRKRLSSPEELEKLNTANGKQAKAEAELATKAQKAKDKNAVDAKAKAIAGKAVAAIAKDIVNDANEGDSAPDSDSDPEPEAETTDPEDESNHFGTPESGKGAQSAKAKRAGGKKTNSEPEAK